jgi:hypothetical protein
MEIGSDAHKALFCRDFIASHRHYEPAELAWPTLGEADLSRLRSVPFWQEVLQTERRAGAIVEAFARTVEDPLIREAIELQGFEEARHAHLIKFMIDHYGLDAREQPLQKVPDNVFTAFTDFGYGECVDAFIGFGAFKMARESRFLPESLFQVLDVLMHEENRHIVFFINWFGYHEARRGRGAPLRAMSSAWYYGRAAARLIGTMRRGAATDGQDFAATQIQGFLQDFSVKRLLAACMGENARRMSAFDPGLLRPRLLPALGGAAFSVVSLVPRGRSNG